MSPLAPLFLPPMYTVCLTIYQSSYIYVHNCNKCVYCNSPLHSLNYILYCGYNYCSYIHKLLKLCRCLYNGDVTASPVYDQYEIPITFGPSMASADDEKAITDDEKVNTESIQDELTEDTTETLIAESGAYLILL